MPRWVNDRGFPLSWQHFNYGLAYLRRRVARDALEISSSMRMASNVKDEDYQEWRSNKNMTAGFAD